MLLNLHINNIVLIEKQDIEFDNRLCVITGETGAGKSIILNSIKLITGKRVVGNFLRKDCDKGSIIAEFAIDSHPQILELLAENDIDHNGVSEPMMVKRIFYKDGRNKCFINDVPVTVNLLANICGNLLEIHGQHEQRGLLDSKNHKAILDQYGNFSEDLKLVGEKYQIWQQVKAKILQTEQEIQKSKENQEYLEFMANEIEDLRPVIGEEEELLAKKKIAANKANITEAISVVANEISANNIIDVLYSLQRKLIKNRNIESLTELFDNSSEIIDKVVIDLEEVSKNFEQELQKHGDSDLNLEEIEERLFLLKNIARKYNTTIDGLVAIKDDARQKLQDIGDGSAMLQKLNSEMSKAKAEYEKYANILSEKRQKIAKIFEEKMAIELRSLHMKNISLIVNIEKLPETNWQDSGYDKISFLASTNPGIPPDSINKISSGGELSRFMLAFKIILSESGGSTTMIFDEIDSGTSGAVADAIGKKLKLLSTNNTQILTITHQAQIAAYADCHFKVEKRQDSKKTTSHITRLNEQQKTEEIARILSGAEISEEAKRAATNLLKNAV